MNVFSVYVSQDSTSAPWRWWAPHTGGGAIVDNEDKK